MKEVHEVNHPVSAREVGVCITVNPEKMAVLVSSYLQLTLVNLEARKVQSRDNVWEDLSEDGHESLALFPWSRKLERLTNIGPIFVVLFDRDEPVSTRDEERKKRIVEVSRKKTLQQNK